MCGIVGIISRDRIRASVIKAMNDCIAHRGPDDEGFLVGGPHEADTVLPHAESTDSPVSLAFGHRRLSIIDLSDLGRQPMRYLDRYWIIYNGEVYNHIELRKELEGLGYSFRSHTDTEVILAAYDAWGAGCLNRLNGMWAFVIYDEIDNRVFISRDRYGVKPLYYYRDEGRFVFASEIKALLRDPDVTREPEIENCRKYLREGAREHLRETPFKDIYRFDNASYLLCDVGRVFEPFVETTFYRITPNVSYERYDEGRAREYVRQYYGLLEDAVRLRLRADVKVGSALSGGLDSSSIVLLINQHLRAQGSEELQETFSSVYLTPGTEACDETEFIDEVAETLRVRSNRIEPDPDRIVEEHRRCVYHLDTPLTNSLMSSWHVYRLTKERGVTVTLDGQGADEQIAGYFPYLRHYLAEIPPGGVLRETLAFRHIPAAFRFAMSGSLLNLSRHLIGKKATTALVGRIGRSFGFEPLNEVLMEDVARSLETLFHWGDHASMAYAVESRTPFMDYRLVDFLASVPASYKIHDGWTKYLARRTFRDLLPEKICWRKDKMGWPGPEEYWFKNRHREHFIGVLRNSTFLRECGVDLSKEDEPEIFGNHPFGFLMRCYNLETWHQVFFGDGEPGP